MSEVFQGWVSIIGALGTAVVLVLQARARTERAATTAAVVETKEVVLEVKSEQQATRAAMADVKQVTLETKVTTDQVHLLTNANFTEQKNIIAKQVEKIDAMHTEFEAAQRRHAEEMAAVVAQFADMKALVGTLQKENARGPA